MHLLSASNRQETLLRKLNRKKYRYKEHLFLIEGGRAVQQIIENGAVKVKALFFDESQQYWEQEPWRKAAREFDSSSLSRELFQEVSDTDTPQGILAVCHMPQEVSVGDMVKTAGLIVALDGLQDPGNLGTIIRTGSWFGIKGLISGKGTVDMFHPKVVRSTAGATGTIPYMNAELSEALTAFEQHGWPVFMLDAGLGSKSLREVSSIEKGIVVVGNEGHGIDKRFMTADRTKVRIPAGKDQREVESLNAAIATSIALYDFSAKLM